MLDWKCIVTPYQYLARPDSLHNSDQKHWLRALLLTDCANVMAGVIQGNPRTKGETPPNLRVLT